MAVSCIFQSLLGRRDFILLHFMSHPASDTTHPPSGSISIGRIFSEQLASETPGKRPSEGKLVICSKTLRTRSLCSETPHRGSAPPQTICLLDSKTHTARSPFLAFNSSLIQTEFLPAPGKTQTWDAPSHLFSFFPSNPTGP